MSSRVPLPRLPAGRIARSRALPWALFVVALAGAVTFAVLWRGLRAEEARADQVRDTARRFTVALTNFSAETIRRDVAEIRSFATGAFAEEVQETFSAERIEAIEESGATSTGEVRSLSVESLAAEEATVFAVVDETVVNAASPLPRTEVLRMEIRMVESSEGWKVSRVDILQSPGDFPVGPGG